jgi:hypothetical protein
MPQNDRASQIRQALIARARAEKFDFTPDQLEEAVQFELSKEPQQAQDPTRVVGSPERRAYLTDKAQRGNEMDAQDIFQPNSIRDVLERTVRDVGVGAVRGATAPGRFVGDRLGITNPEEFEQWAGAESGSGMGARGLSSNPILGTIQSAVEPAAEMASQFPLAGRTMKALSTGTKANMARPFVAKGSDVLERGARWGGRAMDRMAPGLKPAADASAVQNLLRVAPTAIAKGTAANVATNPEGSMTPEGMAMNVLFGLVDARQATRGFSPSAPSTPSPRGRFGQAWDRFKSLGAEEPQLTPDMEPLADVEARGQRIPMQGEQIVSGFEEPAPRLREFDDEPMGIPNSTAMSVLKAGNDLANRANPLGNRLAANVRGTQQTLENIQATRPAPVVESTTPKASPRKPKLQRDDWSGVTDEQVESVMSDPQAQAEFASLYKNFGNNGAAAQAAARGDLSGWTSLSSGMQNTFRKFVAKRGGQAPVAAPEVSAPAPAVPPAKRGKAGPLPTMADAYAQSPKLQAAKANVDRIARETSASVEAAGAAAKAPRQGKLPREEGFSARQTLINSAPRKQMDGTEVIDWDKLTPAQRGQLMGSGTGSASKKAWVARLQDKLLGELSDKDRSSVLREIARPKRTAEEYAAAVAARKGQKPGAETAPVADETPVKVPAAAPRQGKLPRPVSEARAAAEADMAAEGLNPTPHKRTVKQIEKIYDDAIEAGKDPDDVLTADDWDVLNAQKAVAGTKAAAEPDVKTVDALRNNFDTWTDAQKRAAAKAAGLEGAAADVVIGKKWDEVPAKVRSVMTSNADAAHAAGAGKKVVPKPVPGAGRTPDIERGGPAEAKPFRGVRKRRPGAGPQSTSGG